MPHLKAQHAVHGQRVDDLVQVKDLFGIPAAFQVLHQGIDLVAIKQLYELAAQTAVAVFATERAFVFLDQQGGFVGHLAEFLHPFRLLDVDDGSKMQFSRADVGVIDATQAKVFQHLCEVGHIVGQFLRCHGRVLDDSDGFGIAFHASEQTQARLAQAPHLANLIAIDARAGINQLLVVLHQGLLHLVGDGIDFGLCLTAQLDDENGCGVALHEEAIFLLLGVFLTEFQDVAVHQLDGRGMVFQGDEVAQEALLQRVAMGADHHLLLGRQGIEVDFDFGDEGQSAFAACQHLTEVDGAFFKWFGSIVQVFDDLVDGIAAGATAQGFVGVVVLY